MPEGEKPDAQSVQNVDHPADASKLAKCHYPAAAGVQNALIVCHMDALRSEDSYITALLGLLYRVMGQSPVKLQS